jgi:hypothetical protein
MRYMTVLGCIVFAGACRAAGNLELGYVYPAGGALSSEFEVEVGGELADVTHWLFSGEGVKATLIGAPREVTYSKKGKAIVTPVPNRYRFKVTVEKEAKPGLRLPRGDGLPAERAAPFDIGGLPETTESFTNRAAVSDVALPALPAVLNGRIRKADAEDVYRFQAAKGMTLVAFTEGNVLPRGRFHPVLAFTGADGKPCGDVKVFDAGVAPVAVFEAPEDGEYALRVTGSFAGAGGWAGAVYRIKLGRAAAGDGIFAHGGSGGREPQR